MQDQKISGSRNWAVWGLDFLSRYRPDALRFYLTINMPETKDANWDWDDFVTRNNAQLVGTWGNLANRVLSFAHKHWEGHIPTPGELTEADKAILETVESGFESVGELIETVKLRAALGAALEIATEVNKYLDETAPWSAVKEDKTRAATIIYTAMQCIDHLKTIFAPFLPHTSEQLHTFLGYEQSLFGEQFTSEIEDEKGTHSALRYDPKGASGTWEAQTLEPGKAFQKPAPLYQKLDPKVAEEERTRLG
jgi:methionyl-tRNA synthetase